MGYKNTILSSFNRPTRSYLCNISYWTKHIKDLNKAHKLKKELPTIIHTVDDIKLYMESFIWRKEVIDWDPWVITVLNNNLTGDCDDAAVISKYLFELINIPAAIYHLYGKKGAHAVTITEDKKYMVSNSNFCYIDSNQWEDYVYNYFCNSYFIIKKVS